MTENIPSKQPKQHHNQKLDSITRQYLLDRLREIDRLSEKEYEQLKAEVAQLKKIYAASKTKAQAKHARPMPKPAQAKHHKH